MPTGLAIGLLIGLSTWWLALLQFVLLGHHRAAHRIAHRLTIGMLHCTAIWLDRILIGRPYGLIGTPYGAAHRVKPLGEREDGEGEISIRERMCRGKRMCRYDKRDLGKRARGERIHDTG